MNRRTAAAAVLVAWTLVAAPARAGLLGTLHVGAMAGVMSGVGPQGLPLGHGPYAGVCAFGESALGMQLGANVEFASSNDVLHTKFTSLGLFARLSPTPEDYRAYVQLAGGVYHASYSPDPGSTAPDDLLRPGGSFGIGFDVMSEPRWGAGVLANYNAVLFGRRAARSYVSVALKFTLRPAMY